MEGSQKQKKIMFDQSQEQLIKLYMSDRIPNVVLTLAAPGTGKTTTISRIIDAIFINQLQPISFLALTFTRKTRYDLLEKLNNSEIDYDKKIELRSRIKNFHSFAFNMINWSKIISEDEQTRKFNNLINAHKFTYPKDENDLKKECRKIISTMMNEGRDDEEWEQMFEQISKNPRLGLVVSILKQYKKWIDYQFQEYNAITFEYSLVKTIKFIKDRHKNPKLDIQKLQLIIVDQFQDCNPAQMKIVDQLVKINKNNIKLLFVGDFDQNIYTWRGADIRYLNTYFKQKLINSQPKYLSNSYRLNKTNKELSQLMIRDFEPYRYFRNQYYRNYRLNHKNQIDSPVEVRTFRSEFTQVRWVVDKIYEHMKDTQFKDISVLVRGFQGTAFHSKLFHQIERRKKLGEKEILYETKIHNNVLQSKTVKYIMAILSYCKVKYSGSDQIILNQILTICSPIKHVGRDDSVLRQMLDCNSIDQMYILYQANYPNASKKKDSWDKFIKDFITIEKLLGRKEDVTFVGVLKQIVGILEVAQWSSFQLEQSKLEQFYECATETQESLPDKLKTLSPIFSIFKQLSHMSYNSQDLHETNENILVKKRNRVQIQTIHDAKGLQYKVVFICSLNYEFPTFHNNNKYSTSESSKLLMQSQLDQIQKKKQELRIIYTAITRAKYHCYISSSIKDNFIPSYVKQRKQHPQLKFLRQNATNMGEIPFDDAKDTPLKQSYLQKETMDKFSRMRF